MPKWRGQLVPGVHFSFMIHAGKESTSLSSNELSPRSATLIRKHWGRGRRSQNWVNCRQVKRRERGKQTGENSHVQTLRVNDKESFLLSSRDYPDSRCSCAGLHCIQQITLSRRSQVPSNCPEVLLLIISFVEELNWTSLTQGRCQIAHGASNCKKTTPHKKLTWCKSLHFVTAVVV